MYRIEATCRKHSTHHNTLVKVLHQHNWIMTVQKGMCKIFCNFLTLPQAKESKRLLEISLHANERDIRPALPFGVTFSNAYWIKDGHDVT